MGILDRKSYEFLLLIQLSSLTVEEKVKHLADMLSAVIGAESHDKWDALAALSHKHLTSNLKLLNDENC